MPVHNMVHLEHRHFQDRQHAYHLQARCHTSLVFCYSQSALTQWNCTDMVELLLAGLQGSVRYAEELLSVPTMQQALFVALPLVCASCGADVQPML